MHVVVRDGKEELRTVNLESFGKDVVSFGRHPESDIVLKSGTVSRVHGCFYLENGIWHIKDLDSTNGIIYNNGKIDDFVPASGDAVKIYASGSNGNDFVEFRFRAAALKNVAVPNIYGNQVQPQQTPMVQYVVPLGMGYYNFLIWFGLIVFALAMFFYGISFLSVLTIDTSHRYEGQEYMDADTIALLDDLSDEMGVDKQWDKIEQIKLVSVIFGGIFVLFGILTLYIRHNLAHFKAGAPKEFITFMYTMIILYMVIYIIITAQNLESFLEKYLLPMVMVFSIFFVIAHANTVYFEKRKHLFVN